MALTTYQNRVKSQIGGSQKEYVHNQVKSSLDKFLETSQYGVDVLIDGQTERIGVMTANLSDAFDSIEVLSKPNVLKMGTLFEWAGDYWVVLKRTVRVIHESFFGHAYRCNIELKWVDSEGNLKTQKGYGKGRGQSAILVEKKYTEPPIMTRDIDTPITIATMRNLEFKQDMRFLFEGQPYRVTSVDSLSIDGMTILGMYDDILQEGDDVENSLAAFNGYTIELDFENVIELEVGEPFEVTHRNRRDGVYIETRDIVLEADPELAKIVGNTIIPLQATTINVIVRSAQNRTISTNFTIDSGGELVPENIYIIGRDRLEWNTKETYKLSSGEDVESFVTFPPKVKWTRSDTNNSIRIGIGDKYAGIISLTMITADARVYTKEIQITTNNEEVD